MIKLAKYSLVFEILSKKIWTFAGGYVSYISRSAIIWKSRKSGMIPFLTPLMMIWRMIWIVRILVIWIWV